MGLIPEPASLITTGASRFFQGLRTGDQRTLLTGAAIAAVGLWRRVARPKKVLISRTVVKEGSSLVIRNGTDQARVEVRRIDPAT
jgi:hypothetical protein